MMNVELKDIVSYLKKLQDDICSGLEELDGTAKFKADEWQREEGGGGTSQVIQHGSVFEKGGVNFSHVFGKLPDILRSEARNAEYFHATGLSIVIHPQNPFVPIIHMNVRYFMMSDKEGGDVIDEWFGGGIDLSPAYPNEADTIHLHSVLKKACDKFDAGYYPKFKKWSDEYFTIQHRKEMRGVGGIFFDHLRPKSVLPSDPPPAGRTGLKGEKEQSAAFDKGVLFSFLQEVGNSFMPVYSEIVKRNKDKGYTSHNKEWQFIRRGRYAEFNLVYDRGTHFGLKTNGRIESILMSLPPHAEWKYDHHPEKNSEEEKALAFFQPRDWV